MNILTVKWCEKYFIQAEINFMGDIVPGFFQG